MANLVTVDGDRVEFPYLSLQYSITPPIAKLQEGLAAYQTLKRDVSLQSMPLSQRQEILRYLQQLGGVLFQSLFPGGEVERLRLPGPLRLRLDGDWCDYPWELMHDGRNWLHITRGVVRQGGGRGEVNSGGPGNSVSQGAALKMMAVTAQPITAPADTPLGKMQQDLGGHFISTLPHPLGGPRADGPPFQFRAVEHAPRQALEAGLALHPDLLYFSGFADEEGLYLEGEDLGGEKMPWPSFLETLKRGAAKGLKLLILNDSLGYLAPVTAFSRASEMLRMGLHGVVRIEGRLARSREQEYLGRLINAQLQGAPLEVAHLHALRRLHDRFEAGWDWSFLRLYLPVGRGMAEAASGPLHGYTPQSQQGILRHVGSPPTNSTPWRADSATLPDIPQPPPLAPAFSTMQRGSPDAATQLPARVNEGGLFETPAAPPEFRLQRRFFCRESDLQALASAITTGLAAAQQGAGKSGSPLHFIEGAAGSGKTLLALELARRLKRKFAQVFTISGRTLLPDPFAEVPLSCLEQPETPPGKTLYASLASHLQALPAANGDLSKWQSALTGHCQDGLSRLIVLDRLESQPGFEAFCESLNALPPTTRVLILSRKRSPLIPGHRTVLTPVSVPNLVRAFGEEFANRLGAADPDGRLLDLARRDLFAARLLRRSSLLEHPESLVAALREIESTSPEREARETEDASDEAADTNDPRSGAAVESKTHGLVPRLVVEMAMGNLNDEERAVLRILSLFPELVHRETLEQTAGLNPHLLHTALTALQWRGWVDAYDDERYFALHPRIHALVGEQLLGAGFLADAAVELTAHYRQFLEGLGPALASVGAAGAQPTSVPGNGWLHHPPPLLGWAPERCERHSAHRMALLHRLGVERINLVELALLLSDRKDREGLEILAAGVRVLEPFSEMLPATAFLNHCLLALAEQEGDLLARARALNRMALPDLKARRGQQALPKLELAMAGLRTLPDGLSELRPVKAETYRLLGGCHELLGRFDPALEAFHEAAELALLDNRPEDLLMACQGLKRLWTHRPEMHDGAVEYFDRLLGMLHRKGLSLHAARLRRLKADLLFQHGHSDEAIPLFERVLADCREMEAHRESAITLLRMAACRVSRGDGDVALDLVDEAGEISGEQTIEAEEQGRVLTEICRFFEGRNQPEQALRGYLSIRRILEEMGDREALIGVLDRIGGLYFQLGDQGKSTQCYQERLQLQAALLPS